MKHSNGIGLISVETKKLNILKRMAISVARLENSQTLMDVAYST